MSTVMKNIVFQYYSKETKQNKTKVLNFVIAKIVRACEQDLYGAMVDMRLK